MFHKIETSIINSSSKHIFQKGTCLHDDYNDKKKHVDKHIHHFIYLPDHREIIEQIQSFPLIPKKWK